MTVTITTDRPLIQATLISWLENYAGLGANKVIFSSQDIERPAKPYATLFIDDFGEKTGLDDVIQSFEDIGEVIQRITAGPRKLVVRVEIYSDPAENAATLQADDLLEDALLALDTEAIRELFRPVKIGLLSASPVSRVDDQVGERWERRAQAELVLSYSGESFDDGATSGNWIETVDYGITPTLFRLATEAGELIEIEDSSGVIAVESPWQS